MTDVGLSTGQPETVLDPRTGRQIVVVRPIGTGGRSAPKDPWAAAGFTTEAPKVSRETTSHGGDPWAAAGFTSEAPAPAAPVSTGHAMVRGAEQGLTFGLGPAIEGAAEASGMRDFHLDTVPYANLIPPVVGAAKLALGVGGAETRAAYERGRSQSQADLEASREQHPWATTGGELAGSALIPIPGGMAGSLAARTARGAVTGALNAGAYGAGSAISEGKDVPDVVRAAARSAAVGAPLGGTLGAVLGRAARTGQTAGERAARTAEDLGAPLPRGLASNNPAINASAAAVRSTPWFGARMGGAVNRIQEAAGQSIDDIVGHMAGPATDRAAAGAIIRPGLQGVIDRNRQTIDSGYNSLRGQLQGRTYTMPALQTALNAVVASRRAARRPNPEQGLEQFRNLVDQGATFNGAHRARVDARDAGNVLAPHPGYNAGDFNRLTRAITTDLRQMVQADAARSPRQALNAFDRAEQQFGQLSEHNNRLHQLVNSQGEGAVATLLGAARGKGGDLRLLAQLRNSMTPAEFHTIGGVLLHELGQRQGEFSLNTFASNWEKVSDGARRVLFSPTHLQHIEDIVNLRRQIGSALRDTNTSHTSNTIILFDLARDAAMLAVGIGTGHVTAGAAATGGLAAAPAILFAHWLSSPSQAAAMSTWSRAFQAVTLSQTPARIAAFRLATRNLSTNLGIPVEKIAKAITGPGAGRADEQQQ